MSIEQKVTNNIKVPNKELEILKKYFSHCFDGNGAFDFEKFKLELSKNEVNFSKESYGLDWLGKSYARVLATDEATTLLKEDEEFNSKEENKNSQNLLIKGDNLEVLKHLSNAYYEKIKMIYIDPPYNTGSDGFVYQDNRKFSVSEFSSLAGVDEERAKRILDFVDSKSNSHSAWLTFIYPRLYIARQLLKDDGVIFVSIDDNEVAQLRLLMDEIFGEENFVAETIWKKKAGGGSDNKFFANEHEYIICYAKNIDFSEDFSIKMTQEQLKEYKFKDDNFEKLGFYKRKNLYQSGIETDRPNLRYEITAPDGTKILPPTIWRWSKERFLNALSEGKIDFIKNKKGKWQVFTKIYMYDNNTERRIKPRSILNNALTRDGSLDIKQLFKNDIFKYPKPTKLLKTIIDLIDTKNEIILDFFAGSGTTGDALMQLNSEDGGNRKFILVQLPEPIDQKKNKAAYEFIKNELKVETPTVFEITKERLIRARKKIIENEKLKIENFDFGFKIFETMPIWEDYDFEADEFSEELSLFDENKLTQDDLKALLITWKTYDGILLTENLKKIDLKNYTAYYAKNRLYLINRGFKTDNLKTLLEKIDSDKDFNPTAIIAFGYYFESKNLREIAENMKSFSNKKKLDIDFITRY